MRLAQSFRDRLRMSDRRGVAVVTDVADVVAGARASASRRAA